MARPRRLRAQPPDPAHPGGARGALSGVPGPEPHLGGPRGHHQAPAGQRRARARGVRAGRGAHPGGAARRFRGRDRLQQPRHRRRPDLGDVHRGRRSARVALFREAHDEVLARGHRATSASCATRSCAASSTAARRTSLETTLARPCATRTSAPSRTCAGRAGGSSATRRRWRAGVRELKDFLFTNMYRHYRVVRMGDKAGRILRDLFQSYVGGAAAAPAALPGADRRATACTAWCATTSRA